VLTWSLCDSYIWRIKSQTECNLKTSVTSRGRWSLPDPSSATQGISLPMFWDFQTDQTPFHPSFLVCGPSGSWALLFSLESGSNSHSVPPFPADSCSQSCYPRRSGPESGTGCRTPLCWKNSGPPVVRPRRKRYQCQGSHRHCSGICTEHPGRSSTSQRWSGLTLPSQSRCFTFPLMPESPRGCPVHFSS